MQNNKNDVYEIRDRFRKKGRKLDRFYYKLFLVFAIIGVLYHFLMAPISIGKDIRYDVFIIYLPVGFGVFFFGFLNRKFFHFQLKDSKSFFEKSFVSLLYLLFGIILSYSIFGTIARASWDLVNYKIAKQNPKEIIEVNVEHFDTWRFPKIKFVFNQKMESFRTNYHYINQFNKENPEKYYLEIQVQKGIWNHYLVNDWKIK